MNAFRDEPSPRIGYQGSAVSKAKQFALKAAVVVGGGLMLASAVVLSMVFLAVGFAVVLTFGGYLWWQTRDLRRQLRERMQAQSPSSGVVIEGEVIPVDRDRR